MRGSGYRLLFFIVTLALLFLVVPYFFRTFSHISDLGIYSDLLANLQTIGAVILAVSVVLYFALYLGLFDELNLFGGKVLDQIQSQVLKLNVDVRKLLEAPPTVQRLEIPEEMKSKIIESLQEFMNRKIPDVLVDELSKKYSKAIFDDGQLKSISDQFRSAIVDLKKQSESWGKNARANLVIGLGAAIGGLVALYFTLVEPIQVRGSGLSFATDRDAVMYFLSRFSLVLIGESVAFFFLKLYREDRSMIRYLRNEITNIEMKTLALRSSIPFSRQETLEKILENIMNTERNFIIKKGDRIISDVQYENNEIMVEKVLDKLNLKNLISTKGQS